MAHDVAPLALKIYSTLSSEQDAAWKSFSWRGLHFRNRLGIAGGVDKNGELIPVWKKLGVGFTEIGTVTPLAQTANPGKIIDRDLNQKILWNKMGFPNQGMDVLKNKVEKSFRELGKERPPLFINLGKNRQTSLEDAHLDYAKLAKYLDPVADAFVINISSPNTQGLRNLQSAEYLKILISSVRESLRDKNKPVFVKLSPDFEEGVLESTLAILLENSVDGIILTNTTLSRPNPSKFSTEGGVSGAFLADLSKKQLAKTTKFLGNNKNKILLVSVGGLMTAQDVAERLELGADLVQIYSALVFNGPSFFREVNRYMQREQK